MMGAKGLAAAVLASLPLQYGVNGGEIIRDTTYMVVLISIAFTALLVMAYPSRLAQWFYSRTLGKSIAEPTEQIPPEAR
jgi:NhaP-type Na+/H+ or K+/H+ antiporter